MKKYPVGTKLSPKYDNGCTYEIRRRKGVWGFFVLSGDTKGQFHDWDNENEFFAQVERGFTVTKLGGKQTPKQEIKSLREEVVARDTQIAELKKRHQERESESRTYFGSRIRDMNDTISRSAKERDDYRNRYMAEHDRANALSASIAHLKSALKSASESLCHSANAVKA